MNAYAMNKETATEGKNSLFFQVFVIVHHCPIETE